MIRTAVIGYGFSAKTFHIPFIIDNPRFEWTHLVTSKTKQELTINPSVVVEPLIENLDLSLIDLVIITTPNHLHFEQSKYFLNRGCHVVLEKPFVVTQEDAFALKELTEASERQLFIFQNRRWDGDFLTIQELIRTQRIGEVKRLTSRFDRFRPNVVTRWREVPGPGAGILWDLGPHLIDQTVGLFGKPKSITANVSSLREGASVDDTFDIWLNYEGVQVVLGSSSFCAGENSRFVLEGTLGTYRKSGLDGQEGVLRLETTNFNESWGHEAKTAWGTLDTENGQEIVETIPGDYRQFWHHVACSIIDNTPFPVHLDEAILTIQLLNLAHLSSSKGQTLIVE